MGILGNELADSLAKESTIESPESEEVSLAYLKSKLKSLSVESWERTLQEAVQRGTSPRSYLATYSIKPKTRISLPTVKRVLASAFYQLKIGHSYYRDYMYRIEHSSTNLCTCGKVETPRHLLLGCPNLVVARAKLRDSLGTSRLTLLLLLETKRGVEGVLAFLESTRVLMRKWYTQRQEALGA
jgi:hypothetical protein